MGNWNPRIGEERIWKVNILNVNGHTFPKSHESGKKRWMSSLVIFPLTSGIPENLIFY